MTTRLLLSSLVVLVLCGVTLDASVLERMLADARAASERAAADNNVTVAWRTLWRIEPRPFDPRLIELCADAVRAVTGDAPRLPSGPLHDAAEIGRAHV